jgi:replicative DNA helicase
MGTPPLSPEGAASGERWADRKAYTELHVLKNKFGMSGMVKATFAGHITRFSDYQPRSFT